MEKLTDKQLAELSKLAAMVTPGPWKFLEYAYNYVPELVAEVLELRARVAELESEANGSAKCECGHYSHSHERSGQCEECGCDIYRYNKNA